MVVASFRIDRTVFGVVVVPGSPVRASKLDEIVTTGRFLIGPAVLSDPQIRCVRLEFGMGAHFSFQGEVGDFSPRVRDDEIETFDHGVGFFTVVVAQAAPIAGDAILNVSGRPHRRDETLQLGSPDNNTRNVDHQGTAWPSVRFKLVGDLGFDGWRARLAGVDDVADPFEFAAA